MTVPLLVAEFGHFEQLDIRVGRVISVEDFPEARKPLYKITVDFGPEVGIKKRERAFATYARRKNWWVAWWLRS